MALLNSQWSGCRKKNNIDTKCRGKTYDVSRKNETINYNWTLTIIPVRTLMYFYVVGDNCGYKFDQGIEDLLKRSRPTEHAVYTVLFIGGGFFQKEID